MMRARLTLEFTGYWLSGTGAAGAGLDAVCDTDALGCPVMEMSQIKGTLREMAGRLWPEAEVSGLFGTPQQPAALTFHGQATLPEEERQWFGNGNNHAARRQLFRRLESTRINDRGVAEDRTLRRIQVAVPMTIYGTVSWSRDGAPPSDWIGKLDFLCAATPALGKGKADGLGRVLARCGKEDTP